MTGEPSTQARTLAEQGMAALRAGDAAMARAQFEAAIAAGWPGAPVHVVLSEACRMQGDTPARRAALETAARLDPGDLRARLFLGEALLEAGETAAALPHFAAALRLADSQRDLPGDLTARLDAAATASLAAQDALQARLQAALEAEGFAPGGADREVAEAIDIVFGRATPALCRPTRFFYPGLPHRAFYPREAFDWVPALEAQTAALRAELEGVISASARFDPYLESGGREGGELAHPLLDNPDWSAFYLVRQGERQAANIDRCPQTLAAVEAVPGALPAPAPSVLFSLLKPGTAIPPHHGMLNSRLICHLPLIIPEGCGFRVGNDTRAWREGEVFIFDDSVEHEAWNRGTAPRYVLIFEIWHPAIGERQRVLLSRLFEALGGM